jgi:hypothetical protein
MKAYSPATNIGRIRAIDDTHHKTADQPKAACNVTAKRLRKGARQQGRKQTKEAELP